MAQVSSLLLITSPCFLKCVLLWVNVYTALIHINAQLAASVYKLGISLPKEKCENPVEAAHVFLDGNQAFASQTVVTNGVLTG